MKQHYLNNPVRAAPYRLPELHTSKYGLFESTAWLRDCVLQRGEKYLLLLHRFGGLKCNFLEIMNYFFCIWSSCSPDFLEYITGAFCVCICFVDHQNNQKMYIFWVTNVITNITWQIGCCSVQLHRSQLCLNKLKWSSEEATVYNYLEHSFEAWTLELSNARLHPSGRLPAINKRFQTVHASEQHWPIGSSLSSSCFEKEKYGLIWADSTSKV